MTDESERYRLTVGAALDQLQGALRDQNADAANAALDDLSGRYPGIGNVFREVLIMRGQRRQARTGMASLLDYTADQLADESADYRAALEHVARALLEISTDMSQ